MGTGLDWILVVDRDPHTRLLLERAWGAAAHVIVAEDAIAARRRLAQVQFDAVVSEHDLTTGTGLELLEEVRTRFPSAVRVLMSGRAAAERAARERTELVQRFLAKPLRSDVLGTTPLEAPLSAPLLPSSGVTATAAPVSVVSTVATPLEPAAVSA